MSCALALGVVTVLASSVQAHPPARVVTPRRLKVIYVPGSGAAKQLYVVPSNQLAGTPAQPPQVARANTPVQPPAPTEDGREQTPATVSPQNNPVSTQSVFVVRYKLLPTVKQILAWLRQGPGGGRPAPIAKRIKRSGGVPIRVSERLFPLESRL